MSLRTRIAITAALAVALAIAIASLGVYLAAQRSLRGEVDRSLVDMARDVAHGPQVRPAPGPRPGRMGGLGGPGSFVQFVSAGGEVQGGPGPDGFGLPVDEQTVAVASGRRPPYFKTIRIGNEPVRVLTVAAEPGLAIQLARPLGEVATILSSLRRQLLLVGLLGSLLAAGLGMLVARRAVRPVVELTRVAEDVATTQNLTRRIDVEGGDEIGRLAHTFNVMLANLEDARNAQQQLIADASHELRTPLTSLRTNIEVLERAGELPEPQRRALIADVVEQLDEFGQLVTALVDLARGAQPSVAPVRLRLDELVARVVERVRGYAPTPQISLDAQPTTITGEADRLERAVSNLLDNAIKYGGGTPVEVTVRDGVVQVRDHGRGVDEADLGKIFARFYRAPAARSAPGSGLGLSIVEQTAAAHGGSVTVENARDGGAVFTLRLPAGENGEAHVRGTSSLTAQERTI